MKITNVKAMWLRVPIPEAKQSVSDFGRSDSFNTTLVRLQTDAGLVGYGEAKASVGSIGDQRALVTVAEEELAPLLVGEDPRDIARLWEVMYNGSRAGHALSRGRVFPVLGRRGLTICGISGIDMALFAHLWGGALMFSAGLQVCAVSPSATIVEYSLLHNPLQQELGLDPITATEGEITIPDRPGLGVSINEDFVERFTVE